MAAGTGKFLTQDERDICIKIAALNMVLVSQRAQALLLLDDGHTQVKSCELSSLTLGQLRYLLRLFKKKGINLFPEELFPQQEEEKEAPVPAPEVAEPEPAGNNVKKEKKEKKKKEKKGKKEKKKKDEKSSVKKIKKKSKKDKKIKKEKKGKKEKKRQ